MENLNEEIKENLHALFPHPEVNVFWTSHHPYYLFTHEYSQTSAGDRAFYYLCHVLNECGYEAYVVADKPVSGLRTPIITYEIRMQHQKEGRCPIAMYNETVFGNPLEASVVVRWIMNRKVYLHGKPNLFSPSDLCYCWSEAYTDGEKSAILRVPLVDTSIFHTQGAKDDNRTGFCYYAHKYFQFFNGQVELPDKLKTYGTSLCQDIKRSHTEIADILRHSRVLFCYEPSSIMAEAEHCGCPAIYVKSDYLAAFDLESIEYKFPFITEEEIDINNLGMKINADHYEKWIEVAKKPVELFGAMLNQFVTKTQAEAEKCKELTPKQDEFVTFCSEYRPLYIYGGGTIARQCCRVMRIMGIKVEGIVVSDDYYDYDSCKLMYCGLPVFSIIQIEQQKAFCGLVLAMAIQHQDEVIKTLDERGFSNYLRYSLLCTIVGKR